MDNIFCLPQFVFNQPRPTIASFYVINNNWEEIKVEIENDLNLVLAENRKILMVFENNYGAKYILCYLNGTAITGNKLLAAQGLCADHGYEGTLFLYMGEFSVDFDFIQNQNYYFKTNNMDFYPCILQNVYFEDKYFSYQAIDWFGDYDEENNLEIATFDETIDDINILVLCNGEQIDMQKTIKSFIDGKTLHKCIYINYENFN